MRSFPHKNIGTTFELNSLTQPIKTAHCEYICDNYWDTTHDPAFQLHDYITFNISEPCLAIPVTSTNIWIGQCIFSSFFIVLGKKRCSRTPVCAWGLWVHHVRNRCAVKPQVFSWDDVMTFPGVSWAHSPLREDKWGQIAFVSKALSTS